MNIFITHSSSDEKVAEIIRAALEQCLGDKGKVFLSTHGDSIPNGADWVSTITKELDDADGLVVLVSDKSMGSNWVWFELGYFWAKNSDSVFPLTINEHTRAPSPLDTKQAKCVRAYGELGNFFKIFCDKFNCENNVDIDQVIKDIDDSEGPVARRARAVFRD
jgi:hypothetical protein